MTDQSKEAFSDACGLFPGGVNSPVRAYRAVGGDPVFLARGKGGQVWDIDGRVYHDLVQSWGAHILGHAPGSVVKALRKRVVLGTSFGAPTVEETLLGKAIRDAIPSMERLRFVSSGTEAVMSALRVARGTTNRPLVLKFDGCYHGHADSLLIQAGSGLATGGLPDSAGVPEAFARLTLSVPYNDLVAVQRAFDENPGQIAAVIVEPVAANMGLVNPAAGFLKGLRDITQKAGSLLIFDEVITGFRVAHGGAQQQFGVTPDLTTLGKIIGGGLPVGAYGGRRDLMEQLAPLGPIYQAGTLSGNPAAMVAGLEVLKQLAQPDFYTRLNERSEAFYQTLKPLIDPTRHQLSTQGSLFTIFFTPTPVVDYATAKTSDLKAFARAFQSLRSQSVLAAPSQFEANFLGAGHQVAGLKAIAAAYAKALAK